MLFLVIGLYGMALWRHVLQHPVVFLVAALPTLLAVNGCAHPLMAPNFINYVIATL